MMPTIAQIQATVSTKAYSVGFLEFGRVCHGLSSSYILLATNKVCSILLCVCIFKCLQKCLILNHTRKKSEMQDVWCICYISNLLRHHIATFPKKKDTNLTAFLWLETTSSLGTSLDLGSVEGDLVFLFGPSTVALVFAVGWESWCRHHVLLALALGVVPRHWKINPEVGGEYNP